MGIGRHSVPAGLSSAADGLNSVPLENRHIEVGARIVPFAGWNMPVQYAGIIQEHHHTRTKAALFDTSHMGELFLRGGGALSDLDRLLTCRIDDLAKRLHLHGMCRKARQVTNAGPMIRLGHSVGIPIRGFSQAQ